MLKIRSFAKTCSGQTQRRLYHLETKRCFVLSHSLRDGQLGPMLELLKGLLGFAASADGTLRLHGNVTLSSDKLGSCSVQVPCEVSTQLPSDVVKTWPVGIARVVLGGVNVGGHRNCSIDARVEEDSAPASTIRGEAEEGTISISYTIAT